MVRGQVTSPHEVAYVVWYSVSMGMGMDMSATSPYVLDKDKRILLGKRVRVVWTGKKEGVNGTSLVLRYQT